MSGDDLWAIYYIYRTAKKLNIIFPKLTHYDVMISVASICIPFALGVWWIPESPTYLLNRNRISEAIATLRILDREPILEDFFTFEKAEEGESEDEDIGTVASTWTMIKNPANFKPFLSGVALLGFFQVGYQYQTLPW